MGEKRTFTLEKKPPQRRGEGQVPEIQPGTGFCLPGNSRIRGNKVRLKKDNYLGVTKNKKDGGGGDGKGKYLGKTYKS